MVLCAFLILTLWRQKQVDLYENQVNLAYRVVGHPGLTERKEGRRKGSGKMTEVPCFYNFWLDNMYYSNSPKAGRDKL